MSMKTTQVVLETGEDCCPSQVMGDLDGSDNVRLSLIKPTERSTDKRSGSQYGTYRF